MNHIDAKYLNGYSHFYFHPPSLEFSGSKALMQIRAIVRNVGPGGYGSAIWLIAPAPAGVASLCFLAEMEIQGHLQIDGLGSICSWSLLILSIAGMKILA